jgi:hypothetical protein
MSTQKINKTVFIASNVLKHSASETAFSVLRCEKGKVPAQLGPLERAISITEHKKKL